MIDNTDKEWEKYGKDDPYFGVVSHDKYKASNLDENIKEEFFQTGYRDFQHIINQIHKHIDPDFKIKNALDFGCGVGRVLIPISENADLATGVDVSQSMLREAQKNCHLKSIGNVKLVQSLDELSSTKPHYNFIHSSIVFQHIPVKRGEEIFRNLLQLLSDGGCAVVHFTYSKENRARELISLFKKYFPLGKNLLNILKGRSFFYPTMQMNSYNLNRLILLIQNAGIREFFAEYTNHGGDLGIVLYFQKVENA